MSDFDLFGDVIEKEKPAEDVNTLFEEAPFEDLPLNESGNQPPHSRILDHEQQKNTLLKQTANHELRHSLIFHGPRGIGKRSLALQLSTLILKQSEKRDELSLNFETISNDPLMKRITSRTHPDFLFLERPMNDSGLKQKDILDVDTIRSMNSFLRRTANNPQGTKIVVIDDADMMNISAQNSVLKILEEPPKGSFIILICHSLSAMNSTILSRTQNIAFQKLTFKNFETLFLKHHNDLSQDNLKFLYDFYDGSIGRALEDYSPEFITGIQELSEYLAEILKTPNESATDITNARAILSCRGQELAIMNFLYWSCTKAIQFKDKPVQITNPIYKIISQLSLLTYEQLFQKREVLFTLSHKMQRQNLDKFKTLLFYCEEFSKH